MTPINLPEAGLLQFAFLGVCFYQELNGVRYVLQEEGNVGISVVY